MTTTERPVTSLQRRAVLAMALSAGLAAATSAQAGPDLVDLTVVDRETGQQMQVWRHRGRLFVAGQPGARYSLRVANNTGGRVLAVMSVDGVNILTGETAGYDQRGYVFDPYESYDISGWRKSDHEVAQFSFASQSRSYAARTGRPFDVGVIGIAVFRERAYYTPPPPPYVSPRAEAPGRSRAQPESAADEVVVSGNRIAPTAPPAVAQRREERLGTAHGEREWSTVTQVAFVRATQQPAFIRRIEYDTHRNLVAAGVIPPPYYPDRGRPRPFPASGYVPDPPGGS
jgi:hypothetical protein